jgi:hypothetical protein
MSGETPRSPAQSKLCRNDEAFAIPVQPFPARSNDPPRDGRRFHDFRNCADNPLQPPMRFSASVKHSTFPIARPVSKPCHETGCTGRTTTARSFPSPCEASPPQSIAPQLRFAHPAAVGPMSQQGGPPRASPPLNITNRGNLISREGLSATLARLPLSTSTSATGLVGMCPILRAASNGTKEPSSRPCCKWTARPSLRSLSRKDTISAGDTCERCLGHCSPSWPGNPHYLPVAYWYSRSAVRLVGQPLLIHCETVKNSKLSPEEMATISAIPSGLKLPSAPLSGLGRRAFHARQVSGAAFRSVSFVLQELPATVRAIECAIPEEAISPERLCGCWPSCHNVSPCQQCSQM